MIYQIPDKLHLEITTRCPLLCSKCPRTINKGKYKSNNDMNFDFLSTILADRRFKIIDICGALGDPIYHPDFHRFLEKCIQHSDTVVVNTNGSGKSTKWWTMTYSLLRNSDYIYFGVDGLRETSHLYRVNQDWDSVFVAMKLGRKLKKNVVWQWIPFRFNEHQIAEAKSIARRYGILFFILKSNRWDRDDPSQPIDPKLYVANKGQNYNSNLP